jgi:hypothetical protein
MKRRVFTFVGLLATSLWSIANASSVTYNFSGSTQNSGSTGVVQSGGGGMFFSGSPQSFNNGGTASSITVYGETTSQAGDGGPGKFTGTTGLFEVTSGSGGNTSTGIGPYDTGSTYTQGTSSPNASFTMQPGIASSTAVDPMGAPTDQVLLINLSSLAPGSTVSFVMATGAYADANSGIDLWTGTPTGTPMGIGTGWTGQTASNTLGAETISEGDVNGNCDSNGHCGATKTFTISGLTVGTGVNQFDWIAIQADCHYLLLQSMTVTPGAVPEPSFYGFFALALVGLVIGARKLRARSAAAATVEQA